MAPPREYKETVGVSDWHLGPFLRDVGEGIQQISHTVGFSGLMYILFMSLEILSRRNGECHLEDAVLLSKPVRRQR